MRAQVFLVLALLLALTPSLASALCTNDGATVVYVNGILTSLADAKNDLFALENRFYGDGGSKDVSFKMGYNPSHLDGYGDELQSVTQALGSPISDYDLDTILEQIAPDVETRKLLLLGHSQGTFYTNEMYDYLVHNGVPPESISVYNLATPANAVEGDGTYLTSGNDKLVNQVRVWDAEAGAPGPLPANILIPPQPGDDTDIYGGHHFVEDYLAGAAPRIVSDIDASLAKLTAEGTSSDTCFKTPSLGLVYDAQKTAFSLADPAVVGVDSVASKATSAAESALSAVASAGSALTQVVNAGIADAVFSVFPKPDAQNAGTAFSVEKALYGSSLTEADYEALLNGQDLPEEESAPLPSKPQPKQPTLSHQDLSPPPIQPVAQPVPQKVAASTTSSLPAAISISPGFGGGGGGNVAIAAAPLPAVENPESEATSSQVAEQSQDPEQVESSPSDDETSDTVATSTASTTPDLGPEQQPTLPTCGPATLSTKGDFFSSDKDQADYSAAGFLVYHFENTEDGKFTLTWNYFDDECNTSGPVDTHNPLSLTLPSGVLGWSVRFTSMTHFDVWDDQNNLIIGSYDIPAQLPVYTSIAFDGGNFDSSDDVSSFVSRGLKIFGTGEPPSFTNSGPTPAGCPSISATGYFFDPSYENAEYVGGLLRVHLRFLTPYNDGRHFNAEGLALTSNCSFPFLSFGFAPPQTSLTPFIRYYSFRMASSTHWILWDDENNLQVHCTSCEGDIASGTPLVSFFASVDGNASTLRMTPFPPTSP